MTEQDALFPGYEGRPKPPPRAEQMKPGQVRWHHTRLMGAKCVDCAREVAAGQRPSVQMGTWDSITVHGTETVCGDHKAARIERADIERIEQNRRGES